jgi:NAD(P)-dependent dehydrogenase (short-subunit alcohol dehydrogenase family)
MPGSRVLVAGALGGVGGACVELLTRAGQRVVGVDRVAREPAAGATAPPEVHAVDITVPGGAEQAVGLAVATLGGRAVTAAEVAAAVAWLLSPASARTTGAVLPVDGGWRLR